MNKHCRMNIAWLDFLGHFLIQHLFIYLFYVWQVGEGCTTWHACEGTTFGSQLSPSTRLILQVVRLSVRHPDLLSQPVCYFVFASTCFPNFGEISLLPLRMPFRCSISLAVNCGEAEESAPLPVLCISQTCFYCCCFLDISYYSVSITKEIQGERMESLVITCLGIMY